MKPIPFNARALQYCKLREARFKLRLEMRADRCTEEEAYEPDTGYPGVERCYRVLVCSGDVLPVNDRCPACRRNADRYEQVSKLSAKIGGACNAMMNAWRRETR